MRTVWKAFIALALALPLAAYVAGALAASSADEPAPRETIVIQDSPSSVDGKPGSTDQPSPSPSPSGSSTPDDHGGDDGDDGDDSDDDEVRVATPEPEDVDDDHSGPGGGGDDGGDDRDDDGADDDGGGDDD